MMPGIFKAFGWGVAALGFAGWVAPMHFVTASFNVGDALPPWMPWVAPAAALLAPLLELIRARRRGLVTLELASGLGLMGVAAILYSTGSLDPAWPLVTLVAMGGAFATMVAWAFFIAAVPSPRRPSRLFAASLGMVVGPLLFNAVFTTISGQIYRYMPWSGVWTILIAIWALVCFGLAGLSHWLLPSDPVPSLDLAPSPPAASSRDLNPPPRGVPSSHELGQVIRQAVAEAAQKPGLLWVIVFQLCYAMTETQTDVSAVMVYADVGSSLFNSNFSFALGISGVVGMAIYPLAAHFGIQRCWRPTVVLQTVSLLAYLLIVVFRGKDPTFVTAIVGLKGLSATVVGVAWTLYAMHYVSSGRFVLTHYAWITGLHTAFAALCQLAAPYLGLLGPTFFWAWMVVSVSAFLVAGWRLVWLEADRESTVEKPYALG
jgi:hypothetical protein